MPDKKQKILSNRKYTREEISYDLIIKNKTLFKIYKRLRAPIGLPDLIVDSYSASYSGDNYIIDVNIKNIGRKKSTIPSRVYCNAVSLISHPNMNEIREQERFELPEIQPDQIINCVFKFKLADLHAGEVGIIEIIVDPKNEVIEGNESNNSETFYWPS